MTKEYMTSALERFQMWQRAAQGIIDTAVDTCHGLGREREIWSVTMRAYRLDADGKLLKTAKGDLVSCCSEVCKIDTKEKNEKRMEDMKEFLINSGVEL